MIVRETEQYFYMTTQHDHAQLSYEIAKLLSDDLMVDRRWSNSVLLAIREHDRGWIRLDETPIWNDRDSVPFSFQDYPLLPKLILYRFGLDEVEHMDVYAALLCSMHYATFTHLRQSAIPDCMAFIRHESDRQERIIAKLGPMDKSAILKHLSLLRLCDEISLFICLNEPGASKEKEHPWYREGFETIVEGRKIHAHWINRHEIQIRPYLFKKPFSASLKTKQVSKLSVDRVGIDIAYKEAGWVKLLVGIT
ncbi:DUF3891 family protein [Cohnella suwonensis]|uniref:DUF3891 family protein n=1 Tax=Cohnella suwonensis TaxID=696072 RepID=A0ABW0M2N8_9BACL